MPRRCRASEETNARLEVLRTRNRSRHVRLGKVHLILPDAIYETLESAGTSLSVRWSFDVDDDEDAPESFMVLRGDTYRTTDDTTTISCGGLIVQVPETAPHESARAHIWIEPTPSLKRRA